MTTSHVPTATLTELYTTLTEHLPDSHPDFDALVLETVCTAMADTDLASYPEALRAFVQLRFDDLAGMLRQYGPGSAFDNHKTYGSYPYELTRSPTVIAVCERLTVKPMLLRAVWDEQWESATLLEDLRDVWGF